MDYLSPPASIIGCDFSGIVEQVADNPKATGWKVGDRVAASVHGGLFKDKGSFAQLLKVETDLCFRVPEIMSLKDASSYGVSGSTAMQALYLRLGVPWPDDDDAARSAETARPSILIYGASTTAGLMTLQLAKRAGYTALATCSPRNFKLCESYGASQCYDYNEPGAAATIKAAHPECRLAVDCISEGPTFGFCATAVAPSSGDADHTKAKLVTLLPPSRAAKKLPGVEYIPIMAYTLLGHEFQCKYTCILDMNPLDQLATSITDTIARLLSSCTNWSQVSGHPRRPCRCREILQDGPRPHSERVPSATH